VPGDNVAKRKGNEMKRTEVRKLVALYSDDGYLHYASDVEDPGNPYSPDFWPMYSGDDYYRNWDLKVSESGR